MCKSHPHYRLSAFTAVSSQTDRQRETDNAGDKKRKTFQIQAIIQTNAYAYECTIRLNSSIFIQLWGQWWSRKNRDVKKEESCTNLVQVTSSQNVTAVFVTFVLNKIVAKKKVLC